MEVSFKGTGTTAIEVNPAYNSGTVSVGSCRWCGLIHLGSGICPDVKAIEYYPDGTIKRVEFHRRWYIGQ